MSQTPDTLEKRMRGVPISGGVAAGPVCLFNEGRHNRLSTDRVRDGDVERELFRVERATEQALRRLDELRDRVARNVGPAEAEIFVAQRAILEDAKLQRQLRDAVRGELFSAEGAVMKVLDAYELRIRDVASEYLRERATDIAELKRRLLDGLAGQAPTLQCVGAEHCQRGRHRVVAARELTPGLTVELDTEHLRAIITERGGVTSHAAILARALGIPVVSGLKDVYSIVACGTEVLVNGDAGEIVLWPTDATVAAAGARSRCRGPDPEEPVEGLCVMANISLSSDVDEVRRMKAEGIGLYRTEFEFMAAGRVLDEDEQYQRYRSVVEGMSGAPVHLRLLDIGGDKPLPFLGLPAEANPSLGMRGSRLLLARPDLFHPQVRAVARASRHGEIRVLYPMVIDLEQYRELRRAFDAAASGVAGARLRHGVMFEVPAASLQADEILAEADFATIGTNDLVQFLYAVDRNNEWVSGDHRLDRQVLWTIIDRIVAAGRRAGKPVSLCGEMGEAAPWVSRLMAAGLRQVSASVRLIPQVRIAARSQAG